MTPPARSFAHLPAAVRNAGLLLLALLFTGTSGQHLRSISPQEGPELGGNWLTLQGSDFPFFADEVTVVVDGDKLCENIQIMEPYTTLRCKLPVCLRCGKADVRVRRHAGGRSSNALPYTFTSVCYNEDKPILPARFTAAENCTICKEMVSMSVAAMGDLSSYQGIREALRQTCASRGFKSYGKSGDMLCRADYSAACSILYYAVGDAMADAMWEGWQLHYLSGQLPLNVCSQLGRCSLDG